MDPISLWQGQPRLENLSFARRVFDGLNRVAVSRQEWLTFIRVHSCPFPVDFCIPKKVWEATWLFQVGGKEPAERQ